MPDTRPCCQLDVAHECYTCQTSRRTNIEICTIPPIREFHLRRLQSGTGGASSAHLPKLRSIARQHGGDFQPIDLRWGVTEKAASDQQTLNICLEELRRCQQSTRRPNLLVLLGDRYGWRPVPTRLEAAEFEALACVMSSADRLRLSGWYRRDENARHPEYYLAPQSAAKAVQWEEEEQELRRLLAWAAAKVFATTDRRLMKYEASATHQEILQGAIERHLHPGEAFCIIRGIDRLPNDAAATDWMDLRPDGSIDKEARLRLAQLKQQVVEKLGAEAVYQFRTTWPLRPTEEQLGAMCSWLEDSLGTVIDEEAATARKPQLKYDAQRNRQFAEEYAAEFVGRDGLLQRIRDYAAGDDTMPLVVVGGSGSGKTALLSTAALDLMAQDSGLHVVARFAGAMPEATDIRSLLLSMLSEIVELSGLGSAVAGDYWQVVRQLNWHLSKWNSTQVLVLIIDGLEQAHPSLGAQWLDWLPPLLPSRVKLLVSVLDSDGHGGECLRIAHRLLDPSRFIELAGLTTEERGRILDLWLSDAGRTLQPGQREAVLNRFAECPLPLYMKLVFEEVRHLRSGDRTPPLAHDINSISDRLFTRLEYDADHGKVLSQTLAYLCASRAGLSEQELLDVLSRDPGVLDDVRQRSPRSPSISSLPFSIWARLRNDLGNYITERGTNEMPLLGFHHSQIATVASERIAGELKNAHRGLAHYFSGDYPDLPQPNHFVGSEGRPKPNARKAIELPYQQQNAGFAGAMEKTLGDLGFVSAKCEAGLVYDLLDDYRYTGPLSVDAQSQMPINPSDDSRMPSGLIALLVQAEAAAIARNPAATLQQLLNRARLMRNNPASDRYNQKIWAACKGSGREFMVLSGSPSMRITHDKPPVRLQQHGYQISALLETGNGQEWAWSSAGGLIGVCDQVTGRPRLRWSLQEFLPQTIMHNAICFLLVDDIVLVGTAAGEVLAIDLPTGRCIERFAGHTDSVLAIDALQASSRFVTASADGTARIWERGSASPVVTRAIGDSPLLTVRADPMGNWVITGNQVGQVHRWSLHEPAKLDLLTTLPGGIAGIDLPVDDKKLALVAGSNGVWSLQLSDGACERLIRIEGNLRCIQRGGTMTATWVGTADGELICLGPAKRQSLAHWKLPPAVRAICASSGGDRVGVACGDSVYEVTSPAGPDLAATAAADGVGSPLTVMAAAGSTTFVLARRENTVDLWRIEDDGWKSIWQREGVIDASVAPGGRYLYLATAEGGLEQGLVSTLTDARPRLRGIHQGLGRWQNARIMLGWEGVAVCARDEDQQQWLWVYRHSGSILAGFALQEFPIFAPLGGVVVGTQDVLFPTYAGDIVDVDLNSGRMTAARAVPEQMFGTAPPSIGSLLTIPSKRDLLSWTEDGWIKRMVPPHLDVTHERHLDVNGTIVFCSRTNERTVICAHSDGTIQRYNWVLDRIEGFARVSGGPILGASLDRQAARLVVWTVDGVITVIDAENFRELATWTCPSGITAVVNSYASSVTRIAFTDSRGFLGVLTVRARREES